MLVRLGVWGALLQPGAAAPETLQALPQVQPEPEPPSEPAPQPEPSVPISAPATETAPAPVQKPTPRETAPAPGPTAPKSAVDDAAWDALVGRDVVIETRGGGTVEGELIESKGSALVVVRADGSVSTTPKSSATSVRVKPAPPPPSPAVEPSAQDNIAALESPASPEETAEDGEDEGDEDLTEGQKRRKERREKREHALLGAFTMQGATYSHWRGDGVNSGHASYAMDWGVGFNFSKTFGLYAIAGGLLGAKIDGGDTKANYGRVGGVFAFGGKWYYSTVGAGVAFSRLRFEDDTLQKDRGLAIPSRLMLRIPLPKKLYAGIGLTYEFAAVRNFGRYINAIGGQLVFGRW